jgi:hypothetical protein
MKKALIFLSLGFLFHPALRAEAVIESLHWQWTKPADGQPCQYKDIAVLTATPPRLEGRLRARVTLKNNGAEDVDGVLLIYCLTARLASLKTPGHGAWAVPFTIEEKHVPRIGPHQSVDVFLDPSHSSAMPIHHYLQRAQRTGFWPDQLRLQVMLQPRPSAVSVVKTLKLVLPILPIKERRRP